MSPIDHLDIVVTSLERSPDLYRGPLPGCVRLDEIEGARGERVVHLARAPAERAPARVEALERDGG